MTVQEMIEELKKYPPDMPLVLTMYENSWDRNNRGYFKYEKVSDLYLFDLMPHSELMRENGKWINKEVEGEYQELGGKRPSDSFKALLIE